MPSRLALVAVLVGTLLAAAGPATSTHACDFNSDSTDGSLPGSAAKTYVIRVGAHVFYVDDRDAADVEDDSAAGGVFVYLESNKITGLQRSAESAVVENLAILDELPYGETLERHLDQKDPCGLEGDTLLGVLAVPNR